MLLKVDLKVMLHLKKTPRLINNMISVAGRAYNPGRFYALLGSNGSLVHPHSLTR